VDFGSRTKGQSVVFDCPHSSLASADGLAVPQCMPLEALAQI
jgi:hypothetical protein